MNSNSPQTPQSGNTSSPRPASINLPLERVASTTQRPRERSNSLPIGNNRPDTIKPAARNLDGCACASTDDEEQFVYPDNHGDFAPRENITTATPRHRRNKSLKSGGVQPTKKENIPLSPIRPARIPDQETQRQAQRAARRRAAQLDREVRESQRLPAAREAEAVPVRARTQSASSGAGRKGCCCVLM